MKILLVHNKYLEPGGEDEVVCAQQALLKDNGHDADLYSRSNEEIERFSISRKINFLLKEALFSQEIYDDLGKTIDGIKPDVVHIHNPFYRLTPAAHQACFDKEVPVVQSLHNYRWILDTPNAKEFPEFDVPKTDIKKALLRYGLLPRLLKQYQKRGLYDKINRFIVLSEFSKSQFIRNGFPADKLTVVAPHMKVPSVNKQEAGAYGIFVGRLAVYKGIETLLDAADKLENFSLRIIGDGPLKEYVLQRARKNKNISYLGRMPYEKTIEEIGKAAFLIFPSLCYETFGRTIMEAYACGTPVIAGNHGAVAEIVREGETGLTFRPVDRDDLAGKIRTLLDDAALVKAMGDKARAFCEENFSSEKIYHQLMNVYESTFQKRP